MATYEGDVSGLDATAPEAGEDIDQDSAAVEEYREHLAAEQDEALGAVDAKPHYNYDTVFNGVAVELSADQAAQLSKRPEVNGLWRNEMLELDTDSSPDFLGLSGDEGAWNEQFGDPESAGEGVIVGVVDTGFWPENPSLAELPEPRPDQEIIDAKWSGECVEGDDPDDANNVTCNNKVIGARYYDSQGEAGEGYKSPREELDHGSHVGTTAAGNHEVTAELGGGELDEVSGMAPAARLAYYKVCWAASGLCATDNSVAAIEDAVNDGVDVINFSIGGSTSDIVNPVHLAYFNAAAAGVFVSASAGNSGSDGASTVAHNAPWMTTVAASSQARTFRSDVKLGDKQTFSGGALVTKDIEGDLVLAEDVALDDADPEQARLCAPGSLDPDKAEGLIVACARGEYLFGEKAGAVAEAGGAAAVVFNTDEAQALVVVNEDVPVATLTADDGKALVKYADSTDEATIEIAETKQVDKNAPEMADFSSYGPAISGGGDLLKPDITAPGMEILAGNPEWASNGDHYDLKQGTSMSSPHIAGLAALIISANPDWSPMAVKSAMMTTAYQTDADGNPISRLGEEASPLNYGSGHVDPSRMFDPGLVYDSGPVDWLSYGCAIGDFQKAGYQELCDVYGGTDAVDLNYPSMSAGKLAGSEEITRTVTNVSDKTTTYFAKVDAPAGTEVSVSPESFSVKPGKTQEFTVTITRTDAAFDEYTFGSLTWEDLDGHEVRSPIAAQPTPLAVEEEVSGEGASGTLELTGKAGYEGVVNAEALGLTASEVEEFSLTDPTGEAFDTANPSESDHTKAVEVEAPEEAGFARFATFDADHPEGTDVDLYVYEKDGDSLSLVGGSASEGSDEAVTLSSGATYVIYVDMYAGESPTDVDFHSWVVGDGDLQASPESQDVAVGDEFAVEVEWSDLDADARYLGAVNYGDGSDRVGRTIVNVHT